MQTTHARQNLIIFFNLAFQSKIADEWRILLSSNSRFGAIVTALTIATMGYFSGSAEAAPGDLSWFGPIKPAQADQTNCIAAGQEYYGKSLRIASKGYMVVGFNCYQGGSEYPLYLNLREL